MRSIVRFLLNWISKRNSVDWMSFRMIVVVVFVNETVEKESHLLRVLQDLSNQVISGCQFREGEASWKSQLNALVKMLRGKIDLVRQ